MFIIQESLTEKTLKKKNSWHFKYINAYWHIRQMKNAKPIGKGDNIEDRNAFARGDVPRILCDVDVCSRLVAFGGDHGGKQGEHGKEQGNYEGSSHGGIQSLKSSKGWTGTLYPPGSTISSTCISWFPLTA